MSEASEQKALIKWCEYAKVPIFHIPNGGTRNPKEAAELKRQGVKPGVPDLFIPLPRGNKHGMFIEMKYGKNKLTEKQEKWLSYLSQQGYECQVCYSCESAVACIEKYLRRGDSI